MFQLAFIFQIDSPEPDKLIIKKTGMINNARFFFVIVNKRVTEKVTFFYFCKIAAFIWL